MVFEMHTGLLNARKKVVLASVNIPQLEKNKENQRAQEMQ